MPDKQLYRSETNVIFGGVAGGLGEYFALDATLIRIIFVFLTLAGGSSILLYFLLWLLLPVKSKSKTSAITQKTIESNAKDMELKAKQIARKFENNMEAMAKEDESKISRRKSSYWLGFGLIVVGGLLILQHLNIINDQLFWPLALILIGLAIILR